MAIRNTTQRWGAVAQLLHWLIVALIITQFTLATLFDDLPPGARKLALLARHKSVGITILMLAALKHHFVLKDDVLRRMLPLTSNKTQGSGR